FHAGGVPGLTELRFVHTILLEQPDHGIDIGQSLTLIMDRLEDGCMGFFQFAHALQSIEQLTVGVPAATEERRNRAAVGMPGQGFLPLADDRLEVEAVAAAVPEQLGYLYLVRLDRKSTRLNSSHVKNSYAGLSYK